MLIGLIALATFGEVSAHAERSVLLQFPRQSRPARRTMTAAQSNRKATRNADRPAQDQSGHRLEPRTPTRQNVGVVGWAFLPDPSEEIELVGEAHARAVDAAEAIENAAANWSTATETVAALSLGQSDRQQ